MRASHVLAVSLLSLAAGVGAASQQAPKRPPPADGDDGRAHAEEAVVESMTGHHMHGNPHLRLSPRQPERPRDRQRAAAIVASLKPALERYRDYHVALQNGYTIFAPEVQQTIYHFTNYTVGFTETFQFQADHATSLLYRKTKAGYDLIGAMYTAPANATELDLDARVPLSVTQWHQHINICLPPRGTAANADWKKFGPEGSIVAADACRAAGGRFFERLFGWMVHVYPFEKTLEQIWSMDPSQLPEAR
jgi:hypothetical protein